MEILETTDGGCLWCQNCFIAGDLEEHVTGINDRVALWRPQGTHNQGRNIDPRGGAFPFARMQLMQVMQVMNRQIITGNDNIGFICLDGFGKRIEWAKARI